MNTNSSTSKPTPQPFHCALHFLAVAIDFARPAAELVVRDRGRLVEVILIEEHLPHDRAEDAARAGMRRRRAFEKRLRDRTGAAVAPQHAGLRIDVAEANVLRRLRLRWTMRR